MKRQYWKIAMLMFCLTRLVAAQEKNGGSILGNVSDKATGRQLPFVNVVLLKASDSTVVTGIVTDKNGRFELVHIPDGDYTVRFSLIGYKEWRSSVCRIDDQHRRLNLGAIALVETTINLEDVLVTSQKALLNVAVDRKVYNVDKDILSKSGSASDILQNIPSVGVDIDGTVSLRGSSDVLILINGRNSPLMGKSRATVLQQMPANTIETIEVITNPSAKYRPDGTSGIINIVLRKDNDAGANGIVTANAGNSDRYNGNVRVSCNAGAVNIFANYGVRRDSRNRTNSDSRVQTDSTAAVTFYQQDVASLSSPLSHTVAAGIDLTLDRSNSLGLSANLFRNGFLRTETSAQRTWSVNDAAIEDYDRIRHDNEYEMEYGLEFYFQHNFPEEDHRLRLELVSSRAPEQEDNHYANVFRIPDIPTEYDNTLINQREDKNQLLAGYSNPLGEKSHFEAGYEGELNNADFDFFATTYDTAQHNFVKDASKTNQFLYDESIHAFYSTFEQQFGSFGFLGGLRAEGVFTKSRLVNVGTSFANRYFNIYPTLHLTYSFSAATELQLNYSRRTRRPEGDDLNPFPEYRDPRNISAGNPDLLPEYTHSIEFGVKVQNDEFSVLPSVYYRSSYNRFTSITEILNDSTLLTTKANLAKDQSAGSELIISANVRDIVVAHVSGNVFYARIDASNLGFSGNKSTVTWSGALTVSIKPVRTTMVQLNSNYSSYRLTPQGEYRPTYVVNLGIRQELMDGRMSIIATVADLFKTQKKDINLTTPALIQNIINRRDSRIIYVGFSYRFGAPPKKEQNESLRYENDF